MFPGLPLLILALPVLIVGMLIILGPMLNRFPSDVPKDSELVASFRAHHEAFETLSAMALEDSERVSDITINAMPSLDRRRNAKYRELFEQINRDMNIATNDHERVLFEYSGGGIAIGQSWDKGIAYYPHGLTAADTVVNDLDHLGDRDGIYLVPLEKNWYLIYQNLD